jgi:hypothetical protein
LLGNGDGTFRNHVDYFPGSSPYFVAIGDFNGDGLLDAACPDPAANSVAILLGAGKGVFTTYPSYPSKDYGFNMAVANLNGDANLDLALVGLDSSTVSALLGNGNGTFQTQLDSSAAPDSTSVAAADFNGDGIADLAVADNTPLGLATQVYVLIGNGDGTYQAPVGYPVSTRSFSLAVADFNNDGQPDIAVTNYDSDTISILLGNGDGTFQLHKDYLCGSNPFSVAVGDFNQDGKPDLAAAIGGFGGAGISVMLGNGDGTFQHGVMYSTGGFSLSVAVADLNGDGKEDLAAANSNPGQAAAVLLGNGDGTFQRPITYATNATDNAVAIGDLNGDGVPDLAVGGTNFVGTTFVGFISVFLGNGDGTFQSPLNYGESVGGGDRAIAIADLDNDGRLDMAATESLGPGAAILLNTPAVAFYPSSLTFPAALATSEKLAGSRTLTLYNPSVDPLAISSIAVTGEFRQTNACPVSPATLAAGASCNINVTFKPKMEGKLTGTLTFTDNAPGSPQSIPLEASGFNFPASAPEDSGRHASQIPRR